MIDFNGLKIFMADAFVRNTQLDAHTTLALTHALRTRDDIAPRAHVHCAPVVTAIHTAPRVIKQP